MSTFEALLAIRKHAGHMIGGTIEQVVQTVKLVDPDADGYDYESGVELHHIVSAEARHDQDSFFFRQCVFDLVTLSRGTWGKGVTRGRERFATSLHRDGQQCLRAAELMVDPPNDEVIEWWDRLSSHIRQSGDDEKLKRGRIAERLTIDHETRRLTALGINERPKWISIQDNTAGHDILSFSRGDNAPISLRIEVKSTIASPLRFYLSRNEWDVAGSAGDAYIFHVWDLAQEPPRLHVRTVKQIAPHIPQDCGKGKWSNVIVPLGGDIS